MNQVIQILCIACIVYKRVSDDEGRRLRTRQEKQNYEWPLLRYITWEQNGSSYADITYGSYVLITAGLLIGYLSGELTKGRNMESFLLTFGALLFIAVGSLELAALDSVPDELIDNAAILGVVSLITGALFLIDLSLSGKRRKAEILKQKLKHSGPSKLTQTDEKAGYEGALELFSHKMNGLLANGNGKSPDQLDKNDKVVGQLKSSLKGKKTDGETMRVTFPSDILNPPMDLATPSELHGSVNGIVSRDTNVQDTEWDKQPDAIRTSQKLRRGDRIPKLPQTPRKVTDESDADDNLAIPSVSFIMREKGDFGSQTSLRSKSPSLRAKMLPMMPIESTSEEPVLRSPRHLDKSLSQPELGKISRFQKSDSDSEMPHEIVVMSPTEKSEFMAYKKIMQNLANYPQNVTILPDSKVDYNRELKATYSTEEIIEPKPQISPPTKDLSRANLNRSSKPKSKSSKSTKSDRPKGYVEPDKQDENPRDISEDISHMTPSEREHYLFGESPKQKDSTSPSPMMERKISKKSSPNIQMSTSPEADVHWRFDSRDANLVQSVRKNPRDSRESPSSPMDPGYVLHTAHNWPHSTPHSTPKTPSQSPSDVASGTSPKVPYRISSDESDTNTSHRNGVMQGVGGDPSPYAQAMRMTIAPPPPPPSHTHPMEIQRRQESPGSPSRREYFMEEEDDGSPSGGSLTTQLLQKWIKQRNTKVTKMRSEP
ncbi:hypothetical protein R5R35_002355 [Gryllus longicercus]|uniref:Uncharacterized protein n=1 Tax=Gryllus longicercus TaxID=2509291 RepID=A0AAN9Z866_9ORTH